MELVVVERLFEQPVTFDEIQAIENAGSWCLDAHHVRFLKTFFSRDRQRMLCLYEAPDAESARARLDVHESPGGSPVEESSVAEYVIVERQFPVPVTADFVSNALRRAGWRLDLYRTKYVESYLGSDGSRMICVFRAPDAESVRLANERGGVPYTAVWTASVHSAARNDSATG